MTKNPPNFGSQNGKAKSKNRFPDQPDRQAGGARLQRLAVRGEESAAGM